MAAANDAKAKKQLPIPMYIWDSFQSAIGAESRRLAREISQTLGKPETELWNEVKKNMATAYFVDLAEPTNEEFKCEAFELNSLVQRKCCRPVIFGTKTCSDHTNTLALKPDTTLPKYKVLLYEDDDGAQKKAYLLNNNVLDADTLEKIGEWVSDENKLILFDKKS